MRFETLATAFAATMFGLMTAGTALAQPGGRVEPNRFERRPEIGFQGIHRAARSVEKNAHDLHEEVDRHFRRSPSYRHLHEHTREIERLARAIHETTDSRDGRRQLRRLVNKLDSEIHHFVEVVDDSRQFRNIPQRAYAHLRQEVKELHRAVLAMKRQLD